jgi:iron-sulfur cluster assembly protein
MLLLYLLYFLSCQCQPSIGYVWYNKLPRVYNLRNFERGRKFNSQTPNDLRTHTIAHEEIIKFSDKAKSHLVGSVKKESYLYLRLGVKKGGCSGMSYVMDVIQSKDIQPEDHVQAVQDGVECVVDPKSALYLQGLELDYSDALMGGGFKFLNPNAHKTW